MLKAEVRVTQLLTVGNPGEIELPARLLHARRQHHLAFQIVTHHPVLPELIGRIEEQRDAVADSTG